MPKASNHPLCTQRGGCCKCAFDGEKSVGRIRRGAPARPIQPKGLTITAKSSERWGDWGAITGRDGAPTAHPSSVIFVGYGLAFLSKR